MDNEGLCVIQGNRISGSSEGSQALPAHPSDKGWLGYGRALRYRRQVTKWYVFGKQQTIETEQ